MSNKDKNELVAQSGRAIQAAGAGPSSILAGMVADVLTLAKPLSVEVMPTLFRVGDYDFCEPDYKQILLWAEALAFKPEVVVGHLQSFMPSEDQNIDFKFDVNAGRMVSLTWDFDKLPISKFVLISGSLLEKIQFIGRHEFSPTIFLNSTKLTHLSCTRISLTKLDLSNTPNLTDLQCRSNALIELDLSKVPVLTRLGCDNNQLTELDLSKVPALKQLSCCNNQLTELDLSKVPALTNIYCFNNQLSNLDLS